MAYLGQNPVPQGKDAGPAVKLDDISANFDGSETVFNMEVDSSAVTIHPNNLTVYLNGVLQHPSDSYSVSGSQIKFNEAPGSGLSFHAHLLGSVRTNTPDEQTVTPSTLHPDTKTLISGSLGTNASLIRSLTAVGVSGSIVGGVSGSAASTGSFGRVEVNGIGPIGGWVKLQSTTASADATIDFETGIDSTYDVYKIVGTNIHMSGDGSAIFLRVGHGSTPTYQTGGTYDYAVQQVAIAGSAFGNAASSTSGTSLNMVGGVGNATGENANFTFRFYGAAGTDNFKMFHWMGTSHGTDGIQVNWVGHGGFPSGSAITAIRFFASSGTFESGSFALYGLAK